MHVLVFCVRIFIFIFIFSVFRKSERVHILRTIYRLVKPIIDVYINCFVHPMYGIIHAMAYFDPRADFEIGNNKANKIYIFSTPISVIAIKLPAI